MSYYKSKRGINIYYNLIRADAKKPTIVFLHAFGMNHTLWGYYASYLQKNDYPSLVLDLRNHGDSDRGKITIEDYVNDLIGIIKKEGIKNLVLVGYCHSNIIVAKAYLKLKQRVKKIILINYAPPQARKRGFVNFLLALHFLIKVATRNKLIVSKKKYVSFDDSNISLIKMIFKLHKAMSTTTYYNLFKVFDKKYVSIKKFNIPILGVFARKDVFNNTKAAIKFYNAHKNVRIVVHPSSHLIVNNKREILARTILGFISSH